MRRDIAYYNLHAQDVKLEEITSSRHNGAILKKLRENTLSDKNKKRPELVIANPGYYDGEENTFIIKEGSDDWGWLGYFIGRNKQIRFLGVFFLPREQDDVVALMEGIKYNRSIESFCVNHGSEVVSITEHLIPFIVHNSNLKRVRLVNVNIDSNCAHSLAAALKQRQNKSLTELLLYNSNIGNEALANIVDALSGYKQLKSFYANKECMGRNIIEYFNVLAQIIDLNHITSSSKNAEIFQKLRDNVWDENTTLRVRSWDPEDDPNDPQDEPDGLTFCAKEGDDWGWLGYYIGKNKQIRVLQLTCLPEDEDEVNSFMIGLCRNGSIEALHFYSINIDFNQWRHFISHNSTLKDIRLFDINIGLENARTLAMALRERQLKSLTGFCMTENNIQDAALQEITAALSDFSSLRDLCVSSTLIGRGGYESLGAIIRSAAVHLRYISIPETDLSDVDLQTLVAALANTTSLRQLNLSRNRSITATGLRALSHLFHSACPLETLFLERINIGDEGAEILADGLVGNSTLKHLAITPDSAGITSSGWSAFSRLLCDVSSINNTYQSNHTLEHIGDDYYKRANPDDGTALFHSNGEFWDLPSKLARYLKTNKKYSANDAARIKIVNSHPDIHVEVFFQYELKFLPLLLSWIAGSRTKKGAKLSVSAVYKFIRGLPMVVVNSQANSKRSCDKKRNIKKRKRNEGI